MSIVPSHLLKRLNHYMLVKSYYPPPPPHFLNAHSTPSNFKYSGSAKVGKSCFNQRAFSTTSYTTMLKYSETCQTTEGFNPYYIDISIPERVGHEKVKAS